MLKVATNETSTLH